MPERAAAGGRGLLTLLRAAAIVIIATGLNDVIAGAVPSFEPLYVYLGAVALVALLDGIVPAALAAALGVAFYALLFVPRADALTLKLAVPAGLAFGTAVIVSVARGVWRRTRRHTVEPEAVQPAAQAMLPPPQILTLDSSEILLAIDSLRADLRTSVAEAAAAREREAMARDREATLERSYAQAREALAGRLHIAEEESKRLLEAIADERVRRSQAEALLRERTSLVEQLTASREEASREIAALERKAAAQVAAAETGSAERVAAAEQEASGLRARVQTLEVAVAAAESVRRNAATLHHDLEAARAEAAANAAQAAQRASELQTMRAGFEELRRALEVEKGRSEGERGIRTTAVERVKELERTLRLEREAREREVESLRTRLGDLEQTNLELQKQAASVAGLNAQLGGLEQSLAEERQARTAAQSELVRAQRTMKEAEAARGSKETELARVRATAAELEKTLEATRAELEAAVALRERDLSAASGEIEAKTGELARQQEAAAQLRARIAELEAARETDRVDADERLAAVDAQYAADLARLAAEREEARDGVRAADLRIEELSNGLLNAAALEEQQLDLRARLDEAVAALARERSARAAEREEFDAKLSTVAAHLAEDHEADVGRVVEEREAARAELRAANVRIGALEQELKSLEVSVRDRETDAVRVADLETALEEERRARSAEREEFDAKLSTVAAHLAEDHETDVGRVVEEREAARAELRAANVRIGALEQELKNVKASVEERGAGATRLLELEAALEEERRARRAEQAEFDTKLQTIVAHLAHDHETDLGKAMEEKEAARAEARSLSLRIGTLQKKVEEDRASILERLRAAEERQRHAVEDSTRILSETRRAAQAEIDRLRQRIAELQTREAHAAAAPAVTGPEPLATPQPPAASVAPRPTAKPLVLVAHADAEMRMSARLNLERSGYEVLGAADGLEALRTAIAVQPDVVIADAVLPKMGGRELCQLLKSQAKTASIRVVLLTRAVDSPPHGDFPPDQVLSKPVPLESLKAALAGLLAERS